MAAQGLTGGGTYSLRSTTGSGQYTRWYMYTSLSLWGRSMGRRRWLALLGWPPGSYAAPHTKPATAPFT